MAGRGLPRWSACGARSGAGRPRPLAAKGALGWRRAIAATCGTAGSTPTETRWFRPRPQRPPLTPASPRRPSRAETSRSVRAIRRRRGSPECVGPRLGSTGAFAAPLPSAPRTPASRGTARCSPPRGVARPPRPPRSPRRLSAAAPRCAPPTSVHPELPGRRSRSPPQAPRSSLATSRPPSKSSLRGARPRRRTRTRRIPLWAWM